ncbi:uncharacterized protein LOC131293767 [Anopheles ziemanni]|uniref:uncharacterized protein LOC131264547 n=1 Tax=Anopheles coustani TaxID=139045 RepID=UPI00265913AC|nr:uncharacterized protein LOC131264547 [Anopheles coustani]XP_058177810.1 uncharacterized protein LOC131293767 [Anopheles ziemanni]
MEASLEGKATVTTLRQTVTVVIRNVDEVATREEIRDALEEQQRVNISASAVRLGAVHRGLRKAFIRVAATEATTLLEKRLRIGWTSCTIAENTESKKCFRCFHSGHIQRHCEGPDRSGLCMICGNEGHKAAQCSSERRCLDCGVESGSDHVTGHVRCPKRSSFNKKRV